MKRFTIMIAALIALPALAQQTPPPGYREVPEETRDAAQVCVLAYATAHAHANALAHEIADAALGACDSEVSAYRAALVRRLPRDSYSTLGDFMQDEADRTIERVRRIALAVVVDARTEGSQ
jgi:hypothetical protein